MNACLDNSNTSYIHYLSEENSESDCLDLLNQDEQQRAAAFKFEKHRNLYIRAHVFLRKVLSYHTGFPPKNWEFHTNQFGKPFISNSEFSSLQFNLSHTQGMITCAVNKKKIIGVDVEGMRSLSYMRQMCIRNYTEKEQCDIFSNESTEEQLYRFYTYWTLKEALVKALGCGLSMPLNKICLIQNKNNEWSLEKNDQLSKKANTNWFFSHKKLPDNYQISTAVSAETETGTSFYYIDSNHHNSQHWKQ